MTTSKFKLRFKISIGLLAAIIVAAGCQKNSSEKQAASPASLRDIPALKLNFRFEADVPTPSADNKMAQAEERNAAVQNDFDTNRKQEALDKTIFSPDKQRVLAVYHRTEDVQTEYRLDMYAADGKLISKITPDAMAVHFPDAIVWSPDSNNVAFVAMTRAGGGQTTAVQNAPTPPEVPDTNANVDANTNANTETNTNVISQTAPVQAKPVLTFRTEQIYLTNREGADLKPLTQNEGLIYFYFVWSPDSSALAALAATWREWQVGQAQTAQRGENFTPAGRPRLVEKNGRIRILDDNVTPVQPVWSPDSAKVALAFDKDIRIYDAIGDAPTQAAIQLHNSLLLSSKPYDDDLRRKEQSGSANTNANANGSTNTNANTNANAGSNTAENSNVVSSAPVGSLPNENTLVSFNPIVKLEWTEDQMLYLQTGYIKEMKNSADSAHSYLRWHRLIFSPQAAN